MGAVLWWQPMRLVFYGLCSWFAAGPDSAINPEPGEYYIACRWDYSTIGRELNLTPAGVKRALREAHVVVSNPATGDKCKARVADWGPARHTKRAIDMSLPLMRKLGLKTDEKAIAEITVGLNLNGTMPLKGTK